MGVGGSAGWWHHQEGGCTDKEDSLLGELRTSWDLDDMQKLRSEEAPGVAPVHRGSQPLRLQTAVLDPRDRSPL